MTATDKPMRALAMLLALAAMGAPAPASAQDGFALELFEPRPELGRSILSVGTSDLLVPWQIAVGLNFHYEDDPLTLVEPEDRSELLERLVDSRVTAEVLAAVGITEWLSLGVVLPVAVSQTGEELGPIGLDGESIGGAAIGDLRLVPTFRLLGGSEGFGLTVGAVLALPSGSSDQLMGDGALRLRPQIGADYASSGFRVAVEAGYELRSERVATTYVSDDMIRWGVGGRIPLIAHTLDALIVAQGTIQTADGNDPVEPGQKLSDAPTVSAEVLIAAEARLGSVVLSGGGGTSLLYAVGSPDVRAFVQIGWVSEEGILAPSDDDGDGIFGEDACPDRAEDRDGFEDDDGCPDPDDDRDGILDAVDQCPREAEDLDGFEDGDGCPDFDDDGDGITDGDQCPDAAEDRDGFEDEDGCPDPDNDGDGIADSEDKCPAKAEDRDGFEDGDGCPEPDNDQDGIPDGEDRCHDRPEVVNGVDDEDGCPDTDDPDLRVTPTAILFEGRINFPVQSDRITKRSIALVERIAKLLHEHRYITRVRVEAYTDSQGWDDVNLEVSQKRAEAVRAHLVSRGIAPERLIAKGYGEANPIATNDTPGGRWRNRRIEIKILAINGKPVSTGTTPPGDGK